MLNQKSIHIVPIHKTNVLAFFLPSQTNTTSTWKSTQMMFLTRICIAVKQRLCTTICLKKERKREKFFFLPEAGHTLAFDQWGGFLHQVGASGVIIVVPQVGQSRQRSRWYGILFFEDPLVVGWILFLLTLIEQTQKKEKDETFLFFYSGMVSWRDKRIKRQRKKKKEQKKKGKDILRSPERIEAAVSYYYERWRSSWNRFSPASCRENVIEAVSRQTLSNPPFCVVSFLPFLSYWHSNCCSSSSRCGCSGRLCCSSYCCWPWFPVPCAPFAPLGSILPVSAVDMLCYMLWYSSTEYTTSVSAIFFQLERNNTKSGARQTSLFLW